MMFDQFNQFSKTLHNLSLILDKAQHCAELKKYDSGVLLNSRLFPDMFNLTRQVQIACDSVKLAAARLTGKDAPINDDKENTIPELKARIETTIGYLATFSETDFIGWEDRKITQPRWEGKWLTGRDYFNQHVIPNVYFHVTTAYSILRSNGVEIGKKDYLGEMPYKM